MKETDTSINYTREAFKHPLNLTMLLITALSAVALGSFGIDPSAILTLAIGLDLVYLGVVPKLPRFQRSIRLKKMKERDSEAEERDLFRQLDPRSQKRFLVLKRFSELVRENFEKLPYTSQGLLENINRKMEELLSNYITLLDLYKRYEIYMSSAVEDGIRSEVDRVREKIDGLSSQPLKNTKARRLQILEKRLKKFEVAKEKYLICETHLETIEDAIRYIYEQSITMSSSDEIGFQLDNLLNEVEETSRLIADLEGDILPSYDIYDVDSEVEAAAIEQMEQTAADITEDNPESEPGKSQDRESAEPNSRDKEREKTENRGKGLSRTK